MSEYESSLRMSYHGMVSARWHESGNGEQLVIVYFGSAAAVYMPYSEAVVLQADLDAALAQFDSAQPGVVTADWERAAGTSQTKRRWSR